jgi:flagellar hook protein FlgE
MNAISSVSSTSLSGMQAAQTRLQSSGHNIANSATVGFHRDEVVQQADPAGGVDTRVERVAVPGDQMVADAIDQIAAKQSFMANLAVFKSSNNMLGALLDTKA